MGNAELLPFLGTEQAIEDLEALRQAMGDEQFWLYGESYGTQFVQTYAAAYPDRLAGLILDGPVDLTVSGVEFYREQAQAFNDVLVMALQACSIDEACAADMGGDALAAYDGLAARMAQSSFPFDFPLPSGGHAERSLSFSDLETAVMYQNRAVFLQPAAAGGLVPGSRGLRLVISTRVMEPIPDPMFDAVYCGVECTTASLAIDTTYAPATQSTGSRLGTIFYGDLPCVFWPVEQVDRARPAGLAADGIPTLVLVGTADPATPIVNARRIASRLADGYLVTEEGGPHIIFGWGNTCVDDLVTAFVVGGQETGDILRRGGHRFVRAAASFRRGRLRRSPGGAGFG
jgi:pimeloyl-ACP methyl ester carboxylesterase